MAVKELFKTHVGGDGGELNLNADEGKINLVISYPIEKAVKPLIDLASKHLPAWATKYVAKAEQAIFEALGIAAPAPTEPAATAPTTTI